MFSKKRNRRRKPLGKRLANAFMVALSHVRQLTRLALAMVLIVCLPLGIYQGYHALMRSEYFKVSAIRLDGNERVTRSEVLEFTGLNEPTSIFSIDTEMIRQMLIDTPWIIDAEVIRDLPRTVRITVVARQPPGWVFWNEPLRVDHDGVVIEAGTPHEVDGPLITGIEPFPADQDGGASAGRIREALTVINHYQALGLNRFDQLAQIHVDDLLGVFLLTANHGMEVRLGHNRYAERLQRLQDVLITIDGENLRGRYILLDGEGDLRRVAVGPVRPGRDASESQGIAQ